MMLFTRQRIKVETGLRWLSQKIFNYGNLPELADKLFNLIYKQFREKINAALERVPVEVETIRNVLDMPVTLKTYRDFNDIDGFHEQNKSWKKHNELLENMFRENYKR